VNIARVMAGTASAAIMALTIGSAALNMAADNLSNNLTTVEKDTKDTGTTDTTDTIDKPPTDLRIAETENQPINILVGGSDSRAASGNQYGNQNVHQGARLDTTIFIHIPADRSEATAVSIPRDTWVSLPDCVVRPGIGLTSIEGRETKFNAAFDLSGIACTTKLVEQMTGLTVDHFAVIDFEGFKQAIDELGGVEMCIPAPIVDRDSGLTLDAGIQTLTGEQALGFVRARKTLGDGSDISRIGRQQDFLKALLARISSAETLTNPLATYRFLDAASQGLTVDRELGEKEAIFELASILSEVNPGAVKFVTLPWVPRGDGANVVVNEVEAKKLWDQMKQGGATETKKPTVRAPNRSAAIPGVGSESLKTIEPDGTCI